ncbi:hypothetical protein PGB90_000192 [Kerria lacca]
MILNMLEPTPSMKCIRYILLSFNALFTLTGVLLISVGSTVNNIYSDYATFIESRFFSPSIIIISIGCLVFVIASFGCYGAFKLSVAAIMIFCSLLATTFLIEMMVGLVGYILEDQIENMLVKTFDELIAQYKNDSVATNAIDALQNELFCCGAEGPNDWSTITGNNSSYETSLPISCCAFFENDTCAAIKMMGCLPQLEFLLDQSSFLLSSTVLMVAFLQLLGVIFAYRLGRQLREQKTLRDRLKWEVKENVITSNIYVSPNPILQSEYSHLPSYSELFSSIDVNEKVINN